MNASRFVRQSLLALCLSVIAAGVFAQAQEYQPQVGQEGKARGNCRKASSRSSKTSR